MYKANKPVLEILMLQQLARLPKGYFSFLNKPIENKASNIIRSLDFGEYALLRKCLGIDKLTPAEIAFNNLYQLSGDTKCQQYY